MAERRKWSAWVDYRSKVVSQEDMEMESAQRVDVDTVLDLQRLWSDLEASGKSMVDGCNIAVFTKGTKPTWEASQAHGKWVMLTDKRETMSKLMLVLQAVMECAHPNLAHVCGVVLSVRPTRDCIAIWNTKGGDSHFIKATRNSLVHAAGLAPSQKLNYFIIRTGGAGASPPSQAAKANGGSNSNKGGSVSLPPSLPSSQTEGGGLRRPLRPKTGIETDVESLERLRKAMARASPGARPLWGGNQGNVGGGLKVHEVRAEERVWSPYGTNVEQQQQQQREEEDEASMQGWRATATASAAEGLTWPPAGTSFSGVGPLLGGGGSYNAFSGRSIWAPGADAGAYDVDVSPGVARHIEARLASSPSTEGGDSPPSQGEVAGMGMFASYGGQADGGQGGDEAHSLMLSAVPSVGSVGSSWGPSPAVGKNPGFFQAHALSPVEVKAAHAGDGLVRGGAEAQDEDADVSDEEEEEDEEVEAAAQEEEGEEEEVRGQWTVDEAGREEGEGEGEGERGGAFRVTEGVHGGVGVAMQEEEEEEEEEGGDDEAMDMAVGDAVEAAMDGEGAYVRGGVRELSRDLRVKMAMRSVLAAGKLAEKGVVGGKKGRRKDKRSDQSSTESDAVHNGSQYHPAGKARGAGGGGGDVTCAQRTLWALCGAGLTAGSALIFAYISSDAGVPLMMI